MSLPPLALYVHMPWCVRKCPYCDFNSHRAPTELPLRLYIAALLDDLDQDIEGGAVQDRTMASIFMGGGTPSLFGPDEIAQLVEGICARVQLAESAEITLEANPGTIERGAFREYRAAGVNRVSLGVQSFSDRALERLGRIHRAGEVHTAVGELHAAGLSNFNLDLMYALPEQTLEEALVDVTTAIDLDPAHLSHYELTLEPGTAFYRRPPALPGADLAWEMQVESQQRMAAAGFVQYEVSAYARPGRQCRHNLNYWRFGDYLGLGAGAHGKITDHAGLRRSTRQKQPRPYLSSSAAERVEWTRVGASLRPFEFMLNGLRLLDGFEIGEFEQVTGVREEQIAATLLRARASGLLQQEQLRWRPTALGRRFLNDLQALFLPDTDDQNVASS
jgi:putative oxygen-independent coproporphyrinogen III oxidase